MPEVTPRPTLTVSTPSGPARGVALVLHGGSVNRTIRTSPWQLAVLRMRPFATALHRIGHRDGLVVARVRFVVRGWNGAARSPVHDVHWALDRLQERFPGVPAALVGHSMGGRAAVYAADHQSVSTVVGLAPWIEPGDPVDPMTGRRLLVVHGTADRITSPRSSAAFVRRATPIARSASFVSITGEHHAMLQRPALWHELAAGFVAGALLDRAPTDLPSGYRDTTDVLTQALAGDASVVV